MHDQMYDFTQLHNDVFGNLTISGNVFCEYEF